MCKKKTLLVKEGNYSITVYKDYKLRHGWVNGGYGKRSYEATEKHVLELLNDPPHDHYRRRNKWSNEYSGGTIFLYSPDGNRRYVYDINYDDLVLDLRRN